MYIRMGSKQNLVRAKSKYFLGWHCISSKHPYIMMLLLNEKAVLLFFAFVSIWNQARHYLLHSPFYFVNFVVGCWMKVWSRSSCAVSWSCTLQSGPSTVGLSMVQVCKTTLSSSTCVHYDLSDHWCQFSRVSWFQYFCLWVLRATI